MPSPKKPVRRRWGQKPKNPYNPNQSYLDLRTPIPYTQAQKHSVANTQKTTNKRPNEQLELFPEIKRIQTTRKKEESNTKRTTQETKKEQLTIPLEEKVTEDQLRTHLTRRMPEHKRRFTKQESKHILDAVGLSLIEQITLEQRVNYLKERAQDFRQIPDDYWDYMNDAIHLESQLGNIIPEKYKPVAKVLRELLYDGNKYLEFRKVFNNILKTTSQKSFFQTLSKLRTDIKYRRAFAEEIRLINQLEKLGLTFE